VLREFSLRLEAGEVLCLLGRNGAGKTTALKAIMGLVPVRKGGIVFDGTQLARCAPHEIPRLGIGYVPQGRRLFAELTVRENLEIGLMTRHSGPAVLDHVLGLFPCSGSGSTSPPERSAEASSRRWPWRGPCASIPSRFCSTSRRKA
jgi:branched-chain amino acid transport system ATP-binding protein